jgi:uncharacterized protein YbjT (DUF2867 family)
MHEMHTLLGRRLSRSLEDALYWPAMRVVIAGASGLVGAQLLQVLLTDARVSHVVSLGRRQLESVSHAKVEQRIVSFAELAPLEAHDACFIALGTTMKKAGTEAAFRAVDFDAVLAVARASKAAGASKLGLVSALGATASSSVFYNRTKGEAEDAVKQLVFETVVIARPSLLAGDRKESRLGERLGLAAASAFRFAIPKRYRAVEASSVAKGLARELFTRGPGVHTLESEELA